MGRGVASVYSEDHSYEFVLGGSTTAIWQRKQPEDGLR